MNWLKRKINRWLNSREDIYPVEQSPVRAAGANAVDVDGLSFNVMPATGGTVVQIRHYDRKTDRNNNTTHVIPDGEDIAERIGQIVSMELLRA
jgi:hypothetical protein